MAFGIICEYNPFHNGHLHQINEIKRISDEPIICVMSGNFTQRGEVAILDKYERAGVALECGADLVLELPVPFCVASAEYFASAGVHILAGVGVDKLCFGSECADGEKLKNIAQIAVSEEFKKKCAALSKEEGGAAAYFALLEEESGVGDISSNDILGIEYTKAILKNGYDMQIYPIKREGSAYRDNTLSSGIHPSASAIRGEIAKGNYDSIVNFVPETTYKALKNGEIASLEHISDGILLALRLTDAQNLNVAISDVGLINRILTLSHECGSFNELWERLQTKKYTASSLRRAILYILLGIKQSDLDTVPIYTTLLAANERGREYLGAIRKKETGIKIVTKPANAQESRQSDLNKRADALYTMCFLSKKVSGIYLRKSPAIE